MSVYLTPAQSRAAGVGVAVALPVAVTVGALAGPEAGAVAGFASNALYAASADIAATAIRHPGNVFNLAWRQFAGRGGHVAVVAVGLGITFGTDAADALVNGAVSLAGGEHSPAQELFWRLVIGIEPMAVVMAAAAKKGKRLGTFALETLANLTGSALATLGLPIWDHTVQAVFGGLEGLGQSIANQGHYIVGYLSVLAARGWADLPGAVAEEVAEGERFRSA